MSLHIRNATKQDLKQVGQIDSQLFGADAYPPFVLRQLLDICGGLFKVALVGDELIGYAIAHYNAEDKIAWFLSLAVLPAHQGKGTGEGLIKTLLADVAAKGAEKVYLTVLAENSRGIRIYERLGFAVVFDEEDYYGDGVARLVMCKILH